MCNTNTPSVNLQTAVLMQVQEFANSGQTFSRYDVTKALRQKCADGLLEIPEVEVVSPSSSYRYDVRKQAVDDIFEQLFNNCLANGLPPLTVSYNRSLGYREFSVDANTLPASPVAPVAPVMVAVNPAQITSIPSMGYVSSKAASKTLPLNDYEIRRRVGLYMDRCAKFGTTSVKLKHIQSAIKRGNKSTGLSCREIANVVTSLGYIV